METGAETSLKYENEATSNGTQPTVAAMKQHLYFHLKLVSYDSHNATLTLT